MKSKIKKQHEIANRIIFDRYIPRDVMEKLVGERALQIYDLRGQDHTYEELGQIFGVTKERIRQIYAKTFNKFARYIRANYEVIGE